MGVSIKSQVQLFIRSLNASRLFRLKKPTGPDLVPVQDTRHFKSIVNGGSEHYFG